MTWNPDTYPSTIRAEIHDYDELQEQVASATRAVKAHMVLDLGVGAGETASRIMRLHPGARFVGIDSSTEMLRAAGRRLARSRVTLLKQDLAGPLPDQPFDLVVTALAIHHLEGTGKARLFDDVARHLHPL